MLALALSSPVAGTLSSQTHPSLPPSLPPSLRPGFLFEALYWLLGFLTAGSSLLLCHWYPKLEVRKPPTHPPSLPPSLPPRVSHACPPPSLPPSLPPFLPRCSSVTCKYSPPILTPTSPWPPHWMVGRERGREGEREGGVGCTR